MVKTRAAKKTAARAPLPLVICNCSKKSGCGTESAARTSASRAIYVNTHRHPKQTLLRPPLRSARGDDDTNERAENPSYGDREQLRPNRVHCLLSIPGVIALVEHAGTDGPKSGSDTIHHRPVVLATMNSRNARDHGSVMNQCSRSASRSHCPNEQDNAQQTNCDTRTEEGLSIVFRSDPHQWQLHKGKEDKSNNRRSVQGAASQRCVEIVEAGPDATYDDPKTPSAKVLLCRVPSEVEDDPVDEWEEEAVNTPCGSVYYRERDVPVDEDAQRGRE